MTNPNAGVSQDAASIQAALSKAQASIQASQGTIGTINNALQDLQAGFVGDAAARFQVVANAIQSQNGNCLRDGSELCNLMQQQVNQNIANDQAHQASIAKVSASLPHMH